MKRISSVGVAVICVGVLGWALWAVGADDGTVPAAQMGGVRIGVFRERDVALAYYRSKLHNQRLGERMEEHKKAQLAGNKEVAKEIEAEMKSHQEEVHRQVFGTGPYDSLGAQLKTVLPAVAKAKKVDAIVKGVYFAAEGVEVVDVTDGILDELGTDEKTRKIIKDMSEKVRTGQYRPEEYKGEH